MSQIVVTVVEQDPRVVIVAVPGTGRAQRAIGTLSGDLTLNHAETLNLPIAQWDSTSTAAAILDDGYSPTAAGIYEFTFSSRVSAIEGDEILFGFTIDGSPRASSVYLAGASGDPVISITRAIRLEPGETVRVYIFANLHGGAGQTRTIWGNPEYTSFTAHTS